MPDQGRTTTRTTTARKVTAPVTDDAASTGATDQTSAPQTAMPQRPADVPTLPALPEPSPRNGVLVSVDSIRVAFANAHASQAVGYVQHVLAARGLDPDEPTGIAGHKTRTALARFQSSINEPPTGLPTDRTLNYLGFDVM
jgi:peptidoglycan hydrolase-like protein with peptidoglycan-binding domain